MSRPLRTIAATALALLAAAAVAAPGAGAVSLQSIGKFDRPVYVTSAPGDASRLFVVERKGTIEEVDGGDVSLFADLQSVVGCCESGSEGGLLSIALPADFGVTGRLFVFYTGVEQTPGEIHVAELQGFGSGPLRNLLTIPHPGNKNHYGGQLQIGPEGDLFIGTGDGGGSDDVHHNAQSLGNLLGKILRIDPDSGSPYAIPPGNPFVGVAGADEEIWSYGLRNPFRFSFDRLRGDLTIGDVGQAAREEVDLAPSPGLGGGFNYGWNCREGTVAGPATDPECPAPFSPFVGPAFDYPHSAPAGATAPCAIIGGYVVRDPALGDLYGRYLYGDLCVGALRSLSLSGPPGDRSEGLTVPNLNSFGEDAAGRIYAVSGNGNVYRLAGEPAASGAIAPLAQPRAPRLLGIRAQSRHVERGRRALITAFASPCRERRRDDVVKLWRGRRQIGSRHLNRVCSVRFRPRIRRAGTFRATIREDASFLGAESRKLRIVPRHRR